MKIEDLLTKLISFKTISGNHEEVKKVYDFIKSYLGDKFVFKHFEYNGFQSLLISNKKELNNFNTLFNGHIDVVNANITEFTTKIDGDKLYGRGSIDMKGQIACILHLLKNNTFNKTVGFLLTSDEEIGGHNGVEKILQDYNLSADLVIVADAGENFKFVQSQKGLLQADILISGISAHSSTLNLGVNAIINTVKLYEELCNKFNLNPNEPINENISINLSKLNSGEAYNKVPDNAICALDIRYINISPNEIKNALDYVCNKYKSTYKIINYASPFVCDLENKNIQNFILACEEFLGRKLEMIDENGASDIHYFSENKFPAVSINPEGYNLHSNDEYVILSSLYKFEKMLLYYLNN